MTVTIEPCCEIVRGMWKEKHNIHEFMSAVADFFYNNKRCPFCRKVLVASYDDSKAFDKKREKIYNN